MSGEPRIIKRQSIERDGITISGITGGSPGPSISPREPEPERVVVESPESDCEVQQVERVRRLVHAMLSGFSRQRRELLIELQPHVIRISVEVARRIVRRELRTDPGMITRVVGAALEQVAAASRARVRVHPLDARTLKDNLRDIVSAPDQAEAIEIIPDGSIERGGCVVESDRGIVDARLQTQFEEMQTSLLDALESHRHGDGGAR